MSKIFVTKKLQKPNLNKYRKSASNKTTLIKLILITILFLSTIPNTFSQVGINTESPHEAADLTLGSPDKGLLPNRVELISLNNPAPLKSSIANGTIVYNTQANDTDLLEGLYIWQDNQWRRLITALGKTTDFKVLLFNKTGDRDEKALRYSSSPTTIPEQDEIPALSGDFSIDRDGTVMINAVLFAKLQLSSKAQKYAFVGNTFFKIIITDNTTQTSTTFIAACTPVSTANTKAFNDDTSWVNTNNNPEGAFCQGSMQVYKDHNYSVKVYGQEGWVTSSQGTVRAGTYTWGQYRAYSTLRIDYVSDPY